MLFVVIFFLFSFSSLRRTERTLQDSNRKEFVRLGFGSPFDQVKGIVYFGRMLDKIRLHARGELHEDYHQNLGAMKAADGVCCNFLRVHYRDLRDRVFKGGTDEEILEWCFEKGRRLNDGDFFVWNGFASKLGWRDSATPIVEEAKKKHGISNRDDIVTIPELIDFDEGRFASEKQQS